MKELARRTDKEFLDLFCEIEDLGGVIRYSDVINYDLWSHNFFYVDASTITPREINALVDKAIEYQIETCNDFLFFVSETVYDFNIDLDIACVNISHISTYVFDLQEFKHPVNEEVDIVSLKDYDFSSMLYNMALSIESRFYGKGCATRKLNSYLSLAKENDKFTYYGVFKDDDLIGYCYCFMGNEGIIIDNIFIRRKYREQNIGSALIKKIIDLNKNSKVFIHTDQHEDSDDMYLSLGFKKVDTVYCLCLPNLGGEVKIEKHKKFC